MPNELTRHAELIERLEKLDGSDRTVDADIYEALGYRVKRHSKRVSGCYAVRTTRSFAYFEGGRWLAMEYLTASLDAAIALVERMLPGWTYLLDNDSTNTADLFAPDWPHDKNFDGTGETMPIALLIALLRALEGQE